MNRRKIRLEVNAKINLSLNITGVLDNLHTLDMVMASVSLADAVTVCERFDSRVNIQFDSPFFIGNNSTVHKAVEVLRNQFGDFGADIFVRKTIPQMGGLGGSSADAAAVIFALDKILNLSDRGLKMPTTALKVGSDVAYMITGGDKRVLGVGERVIDFKNICNFSLVILCGKNGVDTKKSYAAFDELNPGKKLIAADNDKLILSLGNGERQEAFKQMKNALTLASASIAPDILTNLQLLKSEGASHAFMTGSGACTVGIFDDEDMSESVCAKLVRAGHNAIKTQTVERGINIL